jgi:hypothetical protein
MNVQVVLLETRPEQAAISSIAQSGQLIVVDAVERS